MLLIHRLKERNGDNETCFVAHVLAGVTVNSEAFGFMTYLNQRVATNIVILAAWRHEMVEDIWHNFANK